MKRTVRVKIDFVVEVDGDRDGIPAVLDASETNGALAEIASLVVREPAVLVPGGKISVGLTREASNAARRLRKAQARDAS